MSKAPIWPRHPNGNHKTLGELTPEELMVVKEKCHLEVYVGKHADVKAFLEQQEFKAAERFAHGQDCDFEE